MSTSADGDYRPSTAAEIADQHKAWFYYTDKGSYRTINIQSTDARVSLKLIKSDTQDVFVQLPNGFKKQDFRSASLIVNKGLGQIYFKSKAKGEVVRVELMEWEKNLRTGIKLNKRKN